MRVTVGQVPLRPLVITVVDQTGFVDIRPYATATVRLTNPHGVVIDTSAGITTRTGTSMVKYAWPPTSLFTEPGDYHMRLELTGAAGVLDYTERGIIEAVRL